MLEFEFVIQVTKMNINQTGNIVYQDTSALLFFFTFHGRRARLRM